MVHMVPYLFAAYLLIFLIIRRISFASSSRLARQDSRLSKRWLSIVIGFLLLLPLLPYVVVETQTLFLGRSVLPIARKAMRQIGYDEHVRSLRVLSSRPGWRKVYVVIPCTGLESSGFSGFVIEVARANGKWGFITGTDQCIWTDCGSADGNVFPPYPSKGSYR